MNKKIEDMPLIIWKAIPGYPNYEASDCGDVRSLDKQVAHNYGGYSIKKGKVLSKYISTKGYYCVGVTVNGKTKATQISRLVALAWHENPLNKKTVNHKDTNKLNDCEWNLEWATQQENVIHAIKNNCRKSFVLSDVTIAKITVKTRKPTTAHNINNGQRVPFASISMCAAYLGVSQSAISYAIKRKNLVKDKYLIESGLALDATKLPKENITHG